MSNNCSFSEKKLQQQHVCRLEIEDTDTTETIDALLEILIFFIFVPPSLKYSTDPL